MKTYLTLIFALFLSKSFLAIKKLEPLKVEVTKTEITCFGENDGKIQLLINGGQSPYLVKWSNGKEGILIDKLTPGKYEFKVLDKKGNVVAGSVFIENQKPLSVSFSTPTTTDVSNFNASMNIIIRGGTPWESGLEKSFYMVRIDNKSYYKNPELINNGLHVLEIEDANGCTFDFKVNLDVKLKDNIENKELTTLQIPNLPLIKMIVFPYHLNL